MNSLFLIAVSLFAGWGIRKKASEILRIRRANIRRRQKIRLERRNRPALQAKSWAAIVAISGGERGTTGLVKK